MRKIEKEMLKKTPWEILKDMSDNEIGDILEEVLKNNKIKRSMMKSLDYEDDAKLAMAIKHIKAKSVMVTENKMNPIIDNKQYKIEMADGYYTYTVAELAQSNEVKTEEAKETATMQENKSEERIHEKGDIKTYLEVYNRLSLANGIVYKKMMTTLEEYETEVDGEWILKDDVFETLSDEQYDELINKLYNILDAGKSTLSLYNVSMGVKGPMLKPFVYLTDAHIDIFEHIYTYSIAFRAIFDTAFGHGITPATVRITLNNKDNFVRNHGSFLKLMSLIKENEQAYVGLIEGDWRNIYKGITSAIIAPKITTNTATEPVPGIDIDTSSSVDKYPSVLVEPLSIRKEEIIKVTNLNPEPFDNDNNPINKAINMVDEVEVKTAEFVPTPKPIEDMFSFLNDFGDLADGIIYKRLGFKDIDVFLSLTEEEQDKKLILFNKEKTNMIFWIKESVEQYNGISARLEAGASPIEALGELYEVFGVPDVIAKTSAVESDTHITTKDIDVYNTIKMLLVANGTEELISDVLKVINDTITIGPFVADHKELPVITPKTSKYDFYRVMYILTRVLEFLKVDGEYPASSMLDSSAHKAVDEMLSTYEVIDDVSDIEEKIGMQDQKMFGRAKDLFRSNAPANDRRAIEEIVGFTFTQLNELDSRTTKHRFKEILYAIVWGLIHNGGAQLIKEHHIYDLDRCVNTLEDELVAKFGKLRTMPIPTGNAAQDLLNLIMGGK